MDLTVCDKQIEEEWRQQIIVVAKQIKHYRAY